MLTQEAPPCRQSGGIQSQERPFLLERSGSAGGALSWLHTTWYVLGKDWQVANPDPKTGPLGNLPGAEVLPSPWD